MEARDFRGIGRAAQEALRRRAIVLIEQQGMTQGAAARAVGVQRQTVNLWLKRYRAQGEAGVLDGRRISPRKGEGALTADHSRKVRAWIAHKTPDQLKLVVHPGLDLVGVMHLQMVDYEEHLLAGILAAGAER